MVLETLFFKLQYYKIDPKNVSLTLYVSEIFYYFFSNIN